MSPGVETWGCREYAESTLQDQSYLMGIGLCCWSLDIHFYWKKRAFFLSVEDGFKQFLFSARPLGTWSVWTNILNLGWSHLAYINFEKFCLLPLGLIYAILVHACSTWLRFVDPLDEKVYGIHLPRQRAFFASCKEIMRRKTSQAQKRWDFGATFFSASNIGGSPRARSASCVWSQLTDLVVFCSPQKVVEVVGVFL